MNEIFYNILALIAGGLIGVLFFGGLWITVREGTRSKNPALWFVGSFILRLAIAMSGFYYIAHGSWQRSMICLVGFILARLVIIRNTPILTGTHGKPAENRGEQANVPGSGYPKLDKEGNHEA
ncbi:MAG: ATP synthase subunit I [Puia sp.]|nr:ATP synthase subunit I [Puia sp.]